MLYKIKRNKKQKRRQSVVTGRQQLYCAVQSQSPNHPQTSTKKVQSSARHGMSVTAGAFLIDDSRLFPARAEATGKAQSPSVEHLMLNVCWERLDEKMCELNYDMKYTDWACQACNMIWLLPFCIYVVYIRCLRLVVEQFIYTIKKDILVVNRVDRLPTTLDKSLITHFSVLPSPSSLDWTSVFSLSMPWWSLLFSFTSFCKYLHSCHLLLCTLLFQAQTYVPFLQIIPIRDCWCPLDSLDLWLFFGLRFIAFLKFFFINCTFGFMW